MKQGLRTLFAEIALSSAVAIGQTPGAADNPPNQASSSVINREILDKLGVEDLTEAAAWKVDAHSMPPAVPPAPIALDDVRTAALNLATEFRFANDSEGERLLPGVYVRGESDMERVRDLVLLADRDRTFLRVYADSYTRGVGQVEDRGHWRFERGLLCLESIDAIRNGTAQTEIRIPVRSKGMILIYDPNKRLQGVADDLQWLTDNGSGLSHTPYFIEGTKQGRPDETLVVQTSYFRLNSAALVVGSQGMRDNPPMYLQAQRIDLAADKRSAKLPGPSFFSIGRTLLEAPAGMSVFAYGQRIEAAELRDVKPNLTDEIEWEIITQATTPPDKPGLSLGQLDPGLAAAVDAMRPGFRTYQPSDRINSALSDPSAAPLRAKEQFATLWTGAPLPAPVRYEVTRTDETSTIYGYPVRKYLVRSPTGTTCDIWATPEVAGVDPATFAQRNPFGEFPFFSQIEGLPLDIWFHLASAPFTVGVRARVQPIRGGLTR